MESSAPAHPIRLVVTDDLDRSRLTVFFRLLLAIPHLFVLGLVEHGRVRHRRHQLVRDAREGPVATGPARLPRRATSVTRPRWRRTCCSPATRFRRSSWAAGCGPYPIDLEVGPPARQNRWKTLLQRLPRSAGGAALGRVPRRPHRLERLSRLGRRRARRRCSVVLRARSRPVAARAARHRQPGASAMGRRSARTSSC